MIVSILINPTSSDEVFRVSQTSENSSTTSDDGKKRLGREYTSKFAKDVSKNINNRTEFLIWKFTFQGHPKKSWRLAQLSIYRLAISSQIFYCRDI
jgi:hypothetical protein